MLLSSPVGSIQGIPAGNVRVVTASLLDTKKGNQQMTSYSNQGVSIIVVQYNFGTDINQASQTLTQHITQAQASLPSGVTPQVQTFSVDSLPVIQLAVTSSQDPVTLAAQVKQEVVPALQGSNCVATASVTGVEQQIVSVNLDLKKMQAAGLTLSQVEGVLQANNITLPAGQITSNGQTLPVQVGNTFASLDDLKHLVVGVSTPPALNATGTTSSTSLPTGIQTPTTLPAGVQAPAITPTPITLGEIATVTQTLAPSISLRVPIVSPALASLLPKPMMVTQYLSHRLSRINSHHLKIRWDIRPGSLWSTINHHS